MQSGRPGAGELSQAAWEAFEAGVGGDFRRARQWFDRFASDRAPVVAAWATALRAQRWHADPHQGDMPQLEDVDVLDTADVEARVAASIACAEACRRAVIVHDATAVAAWTRRQRALLDGIDEPRALARLKVNESWSGLTEGTSAEAQALAEHAGKFASTHGIAPTLIEATIIRAVCAEAEGDLTEATALARRGWRMARTEDLPQWQYLANLCLARIRRLDGLPHLSTRILRPLTKVAPVHWSGWIAWEALMAGGIDLARELVLDDDNDTNERARMLRDCLGAAMRGELERFERAKQRLLTITAPSPTRARDQACLIAALDPTVDPATADPTLNEWCRGEINTPPGVIKGLCIDLHSDLSDGGPAAFVVLPADGEQARRVAGIAESVVHVDGRIERVRGKAERTPTTLAAVALAGPAGLAREDLFRAVYGFDYLHASHRSIFKALIHRVRKALGEHGELEWTDDNRFILHPAHSLLIPDPRCEQSLEDVMLRTLARAGAQTARDAAGQLGVPLRTAQQALKRLVDGGALVAEREGRLVVYSIEDTTFSEPTKWS